MAKHAGGRPPFKITDQIIKQVEALGAQGLTQEQIASTIGCHISTLMNKKLQFKEFKEAIKRGQHKGVASISNALFTKAKAGDNVSMIFYLKNRDPKNWADVQKQKIEQSGTVTTVQMSKEEYAEIRKEMLKEDDC